VSSGAEDTASPPPSLHDVLPENDSWCEEKTGFKCWQIVSSLGGVIMAGFYIGNLLFGDASLEVLLRLQSYEENLQYNIEHLKQENARMQKSFFELKELEPLQAKEQESRL